MGVVRREGLRAARHLRGEIWELRVSYEGVAYRLLFAPEGERSQVLLSLHFFSKKTQKTPSRAIELAERRLSDWRSRGQRRGRKRRR
jgi:phage-related protein